uniref:5'-3' exoribonuclease 1 n=1 Tax=Caenorhabditis tropicalis TaxID=1561998 RepID=A0A1I7UUL0_9PELO
MGVPKFYRWTSERYPCLSEVINESQIPEFDNLYLDMNGIIHNCSHPNDDDVTFRITEEEIFVNIFAYIENLYNLIRPQKVFFMAVDGVAPRAKMNQQRARRFMSARTANTQLQKAIESGEVIPSDKRFDSNCITPGTYFMTRLHSKLDEWIKKKSENDPRWHGRTIILSGHNVPGEGEHKIMDYIRTERAKSDYDPNTRHCMYGLDADLIMLGIVSHEPHFSLLREEVKFNTRPRKNDKNNKKPKRTDSDVKTFHLLHLSLLREYLAWEFASVKELIPFTYDMECVADDWILMGLLVGNDFLPHLPSIHIHDDALPLLYATYKKVLPTLDGYINEGGYLNLARFEKFLAQLALNDKNSFMDKLEDEQFMESKRLRTTQNDDSLEASGEEELVAFESSDIEDDGEKVSEEKEESDGNLGDDEAAFVSDHEEEQEEVAKSSEEEFSSSPSDALLLEEEYNDELATLALSGMNDDDFANSVEACWTKTLDNQFKRHKKSYYSDKLRYKNISKSELRAQAEGYVRAIQWNLHYYYHGCVSWSWFYPHHYAPFISDVQGFADMKIEFELSKPFHPFEQLLAVLPEASADCLPRPLQELMSSDPSKSIIHDFYPSQFETDLNGKRNDWEAVVLIPFIEEKRLLEAIESKMNRLSKEEISRNTHGCHIQCISSPLPDGHWRAERTELSQEIFRIPKEKVKWGLLPNVKMDVYFPGFPTMKHLKHTGELRFANCNIFGMASRKESMVLKVENANAEKDIIEWGSELCDEEVCIDWPILKLAKVDSIWGGDDKIVRKLSGDDEIIVKDMNEEEKRQWLAHANHQSEVMMTRYAIEVTGQKDSKGKHIRPPIVWVRKFTGLIYETQPGINGGEPTLKAVKQWSSPQSLVPVLLPLVVRDVLLENSRLLADLPIRTAFPMNAVVWLTDPKLDLFGMPGMVADHENEKTTECRIQVVGMVTNNRVDFMEALREKSDQKSLQWMSAYDWARQANVDRHLFARITGTMFLWNEPRERVEKGQQISSESKINCGLSLKFSRRDLCVADYTDRIEQSNVKGPTKVWLYSNLTRSLVTSYKSAFPEVFEHLRNAGSTQMEDVYYTEDIWKDEKVREKRFGELKEFLNNLPSHEAEQFKCGTDYADRKMIGAIEQVLKEVVDQKPTMSKYLLPPSELFRYELYDGKVHVDPSADFLILDRVALMSTDTKVPKVVQGTVVGIHDDKIDVLFDKEFVGGSKVRGSRLASALRVPRSALFNVTYGLIRKNPQQQRRLEEALDGAYVPKPQKNSKPQQQNQQNQKKNDASIPSTSSTSNSHSNSNSNSKQQKKKENQKQQKKGKTEQTVIVKRISGETPEELLTNSLNKLLKIKPSSEVPSSSNSDAAPSTSGKPVSLMELLGGGGKTSSQKAPQTLKKPEGSKNLEEIESSENKPEKQKEKPKSLLEQLSDAQNGSQNNKNQKNQKNSSQKSNDFSKNTKSSKFSENNKKSKQQKIEILRKPSPQQDQQKRKKSVETEQNSTQKRVSPDQAQQVKRSSPTLNQQNKVPSKTNEGGNSPIHTQQNNIAHSSHQQQVPFGRPPPNYPFPMVPGPNGQFVPPPPLGMFPGMIPIGPGGIPMVPMPIGIPSNFNQQQQNHVDGKRSNPTLTDFKPSAISRRPNHRSTGHQPKVTMITRNKVVTPPPVTAPEEPETSKDSSQKTVSTSASASTSQEKVKKQKKKKQSRLGVNFCNPSPST